MTISPPGSPITCEGITHLLLDIEGTTCPVSFVAEELFPYAAAQLETFLREHRQDSHVTALLAETDAAWAIDTDPAAQRLRHQSDALVIDYLQLLIRHDRKLPALKQLQGLIWEQGYAAGVLRAPLFADVPQALQRWKKQGLVLAVYSSGSVKAQQLLYGHSSGGDLRGCFSHWFDTRSGAKREPASYSGIANAMDAEPSRILFISDALEECVAARQAGLQVLFSSRPGNPARDAEDFDRVESYANLVIPQGPG
ncbi:2,3-diketo-5-methylthio-1-phosphopentane phosphatase [Cyanobium sp. PCC 7001]|uniref:acireductone synthase n=1 Tax=Cyanobium sp. PCC 7001 TaxID=180281 RepID=UPI00018052DD|nr:acireductone synthase [Cyanobium sp. PCC 7001]EDY39624.1 2,3-diketo-5-methylthio-1-phosphopentane phosphatase [Cyanobium sp. PCC 7001]